MRRLGWIALVALVFPACSDAEQVNPLTVASTKVDAGPPPPDDAGIDAEPPPPDDAGPVKRTITQRNPFGNVAETENLLWDGDFEWSSPFADQYGWLSGPPLGFDFPAARIGAECHSGIKCVAVKKKGNLAALGVAAEGQKLDVSFWAHVKKGGCDGVKATVISLFTNGDPTAPVTADLPLPGADGWCRYHSVIAARKVKPYFLIANNTGDEILVDDAVMKTAPPTMALSVKYNAPTSEDVAAVAQARVDLAKLRGPHDSPDPEAKRALQRFRGGK